VTQMVGDPSPGESVKLPQLRLTRCMKNGRPSPIWPITI
jgi:hypothetical protein